MWARTNSLSLLKEGTRFALGVLLAYVLYKAVLEHACQCHGPIEDPQSYEYGWELEI